MTGDSDYVMAEADIIDAGSSAGRDGETLDYDSSRKRSSCQGW